MNIYLLKSVLIFLFALFALSQQNTAFAVQIVRLNLDYNNQPHTMDIELFDTVTPQTVNNFLNYVNSGKYNGSFFNRTVPGFIIQTGGFTFRPPTPTSPLRPISENTGLATVPLENSSPVTNEFALTSMTNVRGTLAMAKLAHNPDSASNEWFINLADNRTNLDKQNGGFTVFGRVIDNGMSLADEISNFPIQTFAGSVLGPAFGALPVVNYDFTLFPPILKDNLVMITSANSSIVRPILRFTPGFTPDGNNFPLDVPGDGGRVQTFTFTNTGNESLTIAPIVNTLASPFTLEADTCSNATLAPVSGNPAASCSLSIRFTAATATVVTDSLALSYTGLSGNYNVNLELKAEGVPATAVLDINRTSVGFSPTDQGGTDTQKVILRNKGGADLTINSITSDNTDFTFDSISCATGTVLTTGQSCDLTLTFTPSSITNTFHPGGSNITGNLSIITSASTIAVPLSGAGVDPTISITPSTVDFGSVLSGQSAAQAVSVQNTGLIGLLIDTITISGADAALFSYSTDCPSGIMNAAASCTIGITFKPNSNGIKNATLVVNSNDANNPQTTIALTGKGIIATTPVLNALDNAINFGSHNVDGTTLNHTLAIDNIGAGIITINSISITGTNASLFGFDNVDCKAGSTLNSCNLIVSFTPASNGNFSANLFIQTTEGDLTIPLYGTGIASSIVSPQIIDTGVSQINGLDAKQGFFIGNAGASKLSVSNIAITGADKNDFSLNNQCPSTSPDVITLNPASQCQFSITLSSQVTGNKTADLVFTTNDPVNTTYTIHLTGITDTDVDGVPASIEQQAPNNGDGNNDNIADDIQNNVASFVAGANKRITLVSDNATVTKSATVLTGVKVLDKIPDGFPADKFFDIGAYNFTIRLAFVGDGVTVGVYLPLDVNVDKFYRFGPTPDNTTPHLYDFSFDAATGVGARVIGPVSVVSKSGDSIKVNLVLINYIDGKTGDDDLTANGFIANSAGGFSTPHPAASSSSSGTVSLYYLLFISMTGFILRINRKKITKH